jgi:hypothetical protein
MKAFTAWEPLVVHDSVHGYYPPDVVDATPVDVVFRNGQFHTGCAQSFRWNHAGIHPEVHIVSYRIADVGIKL